MAILVNWFEVNFDRQEFALPFVDAKDWDSSTEILNLHPGIEIVRTHQEDGTIRLFFVTGTPTNCSSDTTIVAVRGHQSVLARIIEHNLGVFFAAASARVVADRWGVEITREVQRFDQIGLTIDQGIVAKYFAVTEPSWHNGITLNWVVRPYFTIPLSRMPDNIKYDGFPVLLKWPVAPEECPEPLRPYNNHYLGTIVERHGPTVFQVAVRDHSLHEVTADALYLEPRAEVWAELESAAAKETGQLSIQRRILQLSHSLRPDGRRNPGILRDQLVSALRLIDPSDRGQVGIPLVPNCEGKMWINCYATGAQKA